jgi:leucyl-tRNA synthetase
MRETNCSERQIVKDMVIMTAPFAPHFGEECWERLGATTSVFDARWPGWDEGLTVDQVVEVVVQVGGKTRGTVRVARGAVQDAVLQRALKDDTVKRFTEGREVVKVVFVKDRLINIVTK